MDDHNDQNQNADISIEQLQAELEKATNGWKRAAADFENYKRQKEKENKELIEFAKEVTVAKLLPALDSLEQALRHMPLAEDPDFSGKYQNWQKGVNGIVMQLDKTLEELGVKKITALGKKFDPHFHEVVGDRESDEADAIIIEELQSGFELNGKVIRPSQVIISKKSAGVGE